MKKERTNPILIIWILALMIVRCSDKNVSFADEAKRKYDSILLDSFQRDASLKAEQKATSEKKLLTQHTSDSIRKQTIDSMLQAKNAPNKKVVARRSRDTAAEIQRVKNEIIKNALDKD